MRTFLHLVSMVMLVTVPALGQTSQTDTLTGAADTSADYLEAGLGREVPGPMAALAGQLPTSTLGAHEAARYRMRAMVILGGLLGDDARALGEALVPARREAAMNDIPQLLRAYADAYGPAREVAVLGSERDAHGRPQTLVRVVYARGEATLRMIWHEQHLTAVLPAHATAMQEVLAQE